MKSLPTYLQDFLTASQRAHGATRSITAPIMDLRAKLALAEIGVHDMYAWADVIQAAIECGLRSGCTPFNLAQALVNRQAEAAARRFPPPLHQMDEKALEPPEILQRKAEDHAKFQAGMAETAKSLAKSAEARQEAHDRVAADILNGSAK